MSSEIHYVDKHGLKAIFPTSPSTIYRLRHRPVDPFPEGQMIGGKRYDRVDKILDWLARQGAGPKPEDEAT